VPFKGLTKADYLLDTGIRFQTEQADSESDGDEESKNQQALNDDDDSGSLASIFDEDQEEGEP